MKRGLLVVVWVWTVLLAKGQVAEMNWELDYQIFLKMANDSNYTYDISQVFHITDARNTDFTSEFIFYPVNPGQEFTRELSVDATTGNEYSTLWSALHAKLGGGWIHFANCIAYAVETRVLDLQEPILKRPDTRWKPKPVTESWKRTKKWDYYVPVSQKNAIKEYKRKKAEGNLGDLKNLPDAYIRTFLGTSDKDYERILEKENYSRQAQIDLVKVVLGANYLGENQISYISNAVLTAVKSYSATKLPSVLIFDEFDAAAAMTLDASGYKIESIAFKESEALTPEIKEQRKREIYKIIAKINEYNRVAFQKRLGSYYGS